MPFSINTTAAQYKMADSPSSYDTFRHPLELRYASKLVTFLSACSMKNLSAKKVRYRLSVLLRPNTVNCIGRLLSCEYGPVMLESGSCSRKKAAFRNSETYFVTAEFLQYVEFAGRRL